MRTTITTFLAIARLTALEASRQPVFLLLMSAVLVFIALLPLLITHVIGDASRMVRDSALAVQLVSGLVLACTAASATITRELRRGTLAAILSKPVDRTVFFLAKFTGIAAIMLVYAAATTLATLLAVRSAAETFQFDPWGSGTLLVGLLLAYIAAGLQNYLLRTPFVSRTFLYVTCAVAAALLVSCLVPAHPDQPGFGAALPWDIVPAGALIALATVLLSALAAGLSVRLDPVPAMTLCLALFLLGMMSDYLIGRHAADHALLGVLYGVIPNWQHFWAVDALVSGGIPWSYTASVTLYTAVYTAAALCLGLLTFRRMEVK
jgi:hypothetical protein